MKCKQCDYEPKPGGITKWDPQAIKWQCPVCAYWQSANSEEYMQRVSDEVEGYLKAGDGEAGLKYDDGKIKPRLILEGFPRALTAVIEVATFGANKYTEHGWVTVPDGINRYSDAMGRHLLAEAKGEEFDPESKLKHAAHSAWNALARLELILRKEEK